MKIIIDIKANETGYAYNAPEGSAHIEIELSEGIAESVEIGQTVQAAVISSIREYRAAQSIRGKEDSFVETE